MTAENGDGELKQLLEIKRGYRRDLTSFEEELKAKFEHELVEGKKRLQSQYLENIVDVVFAEATPEPPVQESPPAPEPPRASTSVEVKKPGACPECGAPVDPEDKFCSQCAYPLREPAEKEADMSEYPVVTAGRKLKPRSR